MENLTELIAHPERLDKETLCGLQTLVEEYPYYQAARRMLLQNLFVLHDPRFGDELRQAALFVPDRRVLFDEIEGHRYKLAQNVPHPAAASADSREERDRTESLIDDFLNTTPEGPAPAPQRKLTAADATTDYAAFLYQLDDAEPEETHEEKAPGDRSSELIDDFIEHKPDRIQLKDNPELAPEVPLAQDGPEETTDEGFLTLTLAKIYIRQQRYEKALEIMQKVSANNPKKSSYFADQIRFLHKLIINKKHQTK